MKIIKKLERINKNVEIILPSSKSYLNRALIVSSIQNDNVELTNISDICDDVKDLIRCLQEIGIKIEVNDDKNNTKTIKVFGKNGVFTPPNNTIINCGLGGTTTRFLIGLSLLFDFDIVLTATGKMLERPINSLIDAIKILGKNVEYLKKDNCLPVRISGKIDKNIDKIEIDCSKSSQFLSAILLISNKIGLKQVAAKNIVSKTYINITKDVLEKFGVNIEKKEKENNLICNINTNIQKKDTSQQVPIEIDWSSASYFLALEFLFNTKLKIIGLEQKTSQGDSKFIDILDKIKTFSKNNNTKHSVLEINMETMPDVSMTAMVVCAFQDFNTKITGLGTLKNKECNRLKAMHDEFKKIGIKTKISPTCDAITVYGNSKYELKNQVEIETYNDHRIAMCFAILGAKTGHIKINNANVVNKSFPNFWKEFEKIYG